MRSLGLGLHVAVGLDQLDVAEVFQAHGHRVDGRVQLGVGEQAQRLDVLAHQDFAQGRHGLVGTAPGMGDLQDQFALLIGVVDLLQRSPVLVDAQARRIHHL